MEKPKCKNQTSPVKAIRQYCLDCCLESAMEVKLCPAEECPLHPFRFGKNPFTTRTYTDEQRAMMSERAKLLSKSDKLSQENDSDE